MFPARDNTSLSAWALAYAEEGWPVFPLKPRDKTPLTRTGFKAASADPGLIESWWDFWTDANIGLPTGIVFDVLDVDGEEGLDALRAFWKRKTYHHEGPIVSTGRGWHLFFPATGFASGAGLLNHVDFRGTGGYVVAPPSVHPSGTIYQWIRQQALQPAPDWLQDLLDKKGTVQDRRPIPTVVGADVKRPWEEAMQTILLDQMPRGMRDRLNQPSILEVAIQHGMELRMGSHYAMTRCVLPGHTDNKPSLALYPKDESFFCFTCRRMGFAKDLIRELENA